MVKNKKLVLLIFLSILAVASLIYGILTPPGGRRSSAEKPFPSGHAPSSTSKDPSLPERTFQRGEHALWGRTPFFPKAADFQTTANAVFVLNGIVWDGHLSQALINDQIVTVGRQVDGSRVVRIEKDRVVLNDGSQDFELRLRDQR